MNDTSVSAAVRSRLAEVDESLSDVRMGTPVADILDRARRRRARRRFAALAVAAGTGGSAALAAALLASGGAARSSADPAQLTAWTVSSQPNGEITVTIRELNDPAGLQRELRADGVPASVSFSGNQNPACQSYPASQALLAQVYPVPYGQLPSQPTTWRQWSRTGATPPRPIIYAVIRPSALPSGTGVQITSYYSSGLHQQWIQVSSSLGIVYAGTGCTGS